MKKSEHTEQLAGLIDACRTAGLRKTRALSDLLSVLLDAAGPITQPQLVEHEMLREHYDQATLYRLLTRLQEKNIVQRLGLHDRAAHYILKMPEKHDDYLVCTQCGSIESLDIACPVHALEKDIAKKSGYTNLHHELEFFGICPGCAS